MNWSALHGSQDDFTWLATKVDQRTEICICGHAMYFHSDTKTCEFDRQNCRCNHAYPLFVVRSSRPFLNRHVPLETGHALIQGVVDSLYFQDLGLSGNGLGARPTCHECKRLRLDLMPVLMDKWSRHIVGACPSSRMTRMWCSECLERQRHPYVEYVGAFIERAWRRR